MSSESLIIEKRNMEYFPDFLKSPSVCQNLFVITHLGQLKQMESLIHQKNMTDNFLVVLYTNKNLEVPNNVGKQQSENLFLKVIFLEIPFGINRINFHKLSKVEESYKLLIKNSQPKTVYLNSFEGHYSVLCHIAKLNNSQTKFVLVEEGTATYKFNLTSEDKDDLDYRFFKSQFMSTIGTTQAFKKLVKLRKNTKELAVKSKKFVQSVWNSEQVQTKIVQSFGSDAQKSSLSPIDHFDYIYASHPELLKDYFHGNFEKFLGFGQFSEDELLMAKGIIEKYGIKRSDIIFLSQRYPIEPEMYAVTVCNHLNLLAEYDSHIYIKLHPKEGEKVLNEFKKIQSQHPKKFTVIDEPKFLIEPIIQVLNIELLVGLTSSALIYAPEISKSTKSISIANRLIIDLEKCENTDQAISEIKDHLSILCLFDKVSIL